MDSREDILEEIARIYGYHNIPGKIMSGEIPVRPENPEFAFESKLKQILTGWGGTEIYTLSLVPKNFTDEKALKLKNPLGTESEYLRTSLMPSLVAAAIGNLGSIENFHLFEMANIYLPRTNDLPEEKLILAGVFSEYSYRQAKGIVEGLLEKLHIKINFESTDAKGFSASKCALIFSGKEIIGKMGYAENSNLIYYEFEVEKLIKLSPHVITFKEISKYPSQIEDLTVHLPDRTKIGEVINSIISTNTRVISEVEYSSDPFNGYYTFRIKYHNPDKTLTNIEVENIRKEILSTSSKQNSGRLLSRSRSW